MKLVPKWKNEQAGKSFYLFMIGATFMLSSFSAPFWIITDITEPGVEFKLELVEGFACESYVLDEKSMWPDDLCCEDQKKDDEKVEMIELEAIDAKERSDQEKDRLKELRDILPECEPMCEIISDDQSTVLESIKPCKYYQAPGSMATTVGGCTFVAMAAGLLCAGYSLKAATGPTKSDLMLTKIMGGFGFFGFGIGLLAIALFTPGTRGDSAGLKGGFFLQVVGLCAHLGGVICVIDAGEKDLVLPALNFQSFSENDGSKSTKITPKV
jgi:hypothetical protein